MYYGVSPATITFPITGSIVNRKTKGNRKMKPTIILCIIGSTFLFIGTLWAYFAEKPVDVEVRTVIIEKDENGRTNSIRWQKERLERICEKES